ncbi:YcdB/YcdC domain-containing protein ['Paenibacillus yunnanensis' Narsing Rao et al. 2020]|uniref:YcdB/YcdC domain-containing protein n=1 Tax=Paenibacillus tengchongensis TaxID=2608684 RepID=UPI00124F1AB3|nr:S-layer homology domain-containing protein [Paenibacillus tengchongensis]
MSYFNGKFVLRRPMKAALVAAMSLPLLLPAGPAAADSVVSESVTVTSGPGTAAASQAYSSATAVSADAASKAKITQEQAVARLRELFPKLKDATVSGVQLGNTNSYPVNENQLVWTINWSLNYGNTGYSFSSEVDAVSGDLVNTYLSSPLLEQAKGYYPPKISREEGEKIASAFVLKAAPSLKSGDFKITDEQILGADSALFGPIRYYYIFSVLKNGLPSNRDQVSVSVSGDGEILSFTKPYIDAVYPSPKPSISKEAAEQILSKDFAVELAYIPIYNASKVERWILGWRPSQNSLSDISAVNGKRISSDGKEAAAAAFAYEAVPKSKTPFQKASGGKELTAGQAAAAVQKVASIPAERKLTGQVLSNSYNDPGGKTWSLTWQNTANYNPGGFPARTYAEVNAITGEITQYQQEQFGTEQSQTKPASGAKKLTPAAAKQRALALIDVLYDNASGNLKLAWNGEENSVLPDDQGYSYQFVRNYQGIPVSDTNIQLSMDVYGNLITYYAVGRADLELPASINAQPAVTKEAARQTYLDNYLVQLKYATYGGYFSSATYLKPEVKLVYALEPENEAEPYSVLDAATGQWVATYKTVQGTVKPGEVADLKGHPAEKQLTELVKFGVLVPDGEGKIHPEQEITVGDWLNLAVKAAVPYYSTYSGSEEKAVAGVAPDDEDYNVVKYAVQLGWIDGDAVLQTEQKLTRDGLAYYLAAALKYDKLAAFLQHDSAVEGFSDSAAIKNKGAVALALKLGLLQGEGGAFQPQKTVTRADAAVILMKMAELQGQIDQAIGMQ